MHAWEPPGQLGELPVLGHAEVRDDEGQIRVGRQEPPDPLRAGVLAGERLGARVDHDRDT
ncbi:hypothetical protein GCM10009849_03870 [Sinomonas flava]|uniref:Uncharacterized protein n=1 Tax=Sinomonas flava TaxID=496857 RepID=A0ABP5NFQ4_9MICC